MNTKIGRAEWGSWVPLLMTVIVLAAGAAVAFS